MKKIIILALIFPCFVVNAEFLEGVDGSGDFLKGKENSTVGGATVDMSVNSIQLNTSPIIGAHVTGLFHWDSINKTIEVGMEGTEVNLQVGEETVTYVYNDSGADILNGTIVKVNGGVTGGFPEIVKAQADVQANAVISGIATELIEDETYGYITTFGVVRGVNTALYAQGTELWLSETTAGVWTDTKPLPPCFAVFVGRVQVSDAVNGTISMNSYTQQQEVRYDTIWTTIPLRGVTDTQIILTGELREESAGEVGDYATDFSVQNQHVYLDINSITGSGDITITGTTLSESYAVPQTGQTEAITVDGVHLYQSDKKWLEVINIDIPVGITVVNYDIGIVGYTDINNRDFMVHGFRLDATAQGLNPDFRFQLIKVQDNGSKQMELVYIEDIGIDSGSAGNQIVDHIRTGGNDRSYNPTVGQIFGDNTVHTIKMGDFSTYFTSDENIMESSTKAEGLIIRVQGEGDANITNVDFISLQLRYSVL